MVRRDLEVKYMTWEDVCLMAMGRQVLIEMSESLEAFKIHLHPVCDTV